MSPSAWELDQRPLTACVVCEGVPERRIELPELPDIHSVFGNPTICTPCWATAERGDADQLLRRAAISGIDDEDGSLQVVRLVLAAAGSEPPAARPARAARAARPPLSAADTRIWRDLEPLVFGGLPADGTVRGVIEEVRGGRLSVTGVLLAGQRMRLSDDHGQPFLITDGVTVWQRSDAGMVAEEYRGARWAGGGIELAHHRSRDDVDVFGFGQPVGPFRRVEQLGRPAWQFAFAAPPNKPFDMDVVVDVGTGLVLEQRFADYSVARWTSFVTGEPVNPAAFTWAGPVLVGRELRADREREHEADLARRQEWFEANVTTQPIAVAGLPVEVFVHEWEADGSFQASLDGGLDGDLARRPRSADWWGLGWTDVTLRWSDDRWDWALGVWDPDGLVGLGDAVLADLWRALGSPPSGGR